MRSSSWRSACLPVLCMALWAGAALGKTPPASYAPWPEPDHGYVTDLAQVLSPQEEERIEQWLWQVETRTGVEVIVVTVYSIRDFPGTDNGSIESFAHGLFDAYGVGNLPANNGVLIVVAVGDRKARIELGKGYGHTRDADAQRIMDDVMIPAFRDGNYAGGITEAVKAVAHEFAGVRIGFPWALVYLGVGVLAALLIGISLVRNGKKGWGWVFVGLALVLLLTLLWILYFTLRALPRTSSSGWSAGGAGGFGGGSSGGGGASGSW